MPIRDTNGFRLPASIQLVHAVLPPWDPWYRAEPQSITHNFDRELLPAGSRLVGLISRGEREYSAIAVLKKAANTSTFQRRLKFESISPIGPIEFSQVHAELPRRLQRHFEDSTRRDVAGLPRKTAHAVAEALARLDPSFDGILAQAVRAIEGKSISLVRRSNAWRMMAWEKSALDTALQLGGLPHSTLSEEPSELSHASPIPDLLSGGTVGEDRQIEHDAAAFGGLELLHADVRGRVFIDDDARSRVTVINANRGPLERTLGVDLAVHYERFGSYLLIQYKRLVREKSRSRSPEWRFRPRRDRNYAREVRRMMTIRENLLGLPPQSPFDYRLSDDPFFFKFCRNDMFDPDRTGMTPGLHVPMCDVDHFLNSPYAKGRRGGAYLGYDNLPRRLPNTQFLELARSGWIGSRSLGSDQIHSVVVASLEASHSVMMANIAGSSDGGGLAADLDDD